MRSPASAELGLQTVVEALQASWSGETCHPDNQFTLDNPARGQCVVSSLVIQDYFGGDLRRYRTVYEGNEEMHYCNILPDGTIVDTTGSQYQTPVSLEVLPVELKGYATIREKRLAEDETRQRYELLSNLVGRWLKTKGLL